LHFTQLVRNQGGDFTFYDPCLGQVEDKTKANKQSERLGEETKCFRSCSALEVFAVNKVRPWYVRLLQCVKGFIIKPK